MTTQTERAFTTDQDAYKIFVGQITPQEFVAPYEVNFDDPIVNFNCPISEAIEDFIRQWPHDEAPPSWLEDALYRYIESQLEVN